MATARTGTEVWSCTRTTRAPGADGKASMRAVPWTTTSRAVVQQLVAIVGADRLTCPPAPRPRRSARPAPSRSVRRSRASCGGRAHQVPDPGIVARSRDSVARSAGSVAVPMPAGRPVHQVEPRGNSRGPASHEGAFRINYYVHAGLASERRRDLMARRRLLAGPGKRGRTGGGPACPLLAGRRLLAGQLVAVRLAGGAGVRAEGKRTVLRDGSEVLIRPVQGADAPLWPVALPG